MIEENEICGNCFFADVTPCGECDCTLEDNIISVGYHDKACDGFESRTGMFDREELNYD